MRGGGVLETKNTTAPATRTLNRNKRKDLTGKMSEKE
jgi:hypothetical protein